MKSPAVAVTPVLSGIVSEIEGARVDFLTDPTTFPAASHIDTALLSSIGHARNAESLALQGQLAEMRAALRKAIDQLELAYTFMNYGFTPDPLVAAEFFVRQHYVDFLDREPDEQGFNFWVGQIKECGANRRCADNRRDHVSEAFFLSIEFQESGYLVHRAHKASFGRMPSMSALVADARAVSRGVIVHQPGWRERLEANTQAFVEDWVRRDEFTSRYAGMQGAAFIDALIANTGAAVTPAERTHLISELARTSSRAHVMRLLLSNEQFVQSEKNHAFVLMQYIGYLRRDPDQTGYQFWLGKLNDHGGNAIAAEMVRSFLVSTEYRGRFRQQ